jgi:hypothetical protein
MQLSDVLNLPEKTWTQKGNGVNAVINTVHKAKQGQYGWKQPVNVTDLTGATMDITFETEYPESLLSQDHVGKKAIWRLKWWQGRRGQNVSGYPEQQLNEAGQPVKWQLPPALQTPQNQQQAPQQAPQPTNSPQDVQIRMPDTYAYPVTPTTARRMARCVFIEAMLRNGQKPLYSYIEELVEFTMTGVNAASIPDPDPDITVCPHCNKPHSECSCTPAF